MKKITVILAAAFMLIVSGRMNAQTATTKIASATEVTPANVLKWTKEVLPKMEPLIPKLEKIKATTTGKSKMDGIKYLVAVTQLKEINSKGARLKSGKAKKYYDLIAATINSFYIECQSSPNDNGVCCIDCHNHGILSLWCFANCFVARFPGID